WAIRRLWNHAASWSRRLSSLSMSPLGGKGGTPKGYSGNTLRLVVGVVRSSSTPHVSPVNLSDRCPVHTEWPRFLAERGRSSNAAGLKLHRRWLARRAATKH